MSNDQTFLRELMPNIQHELRVAARRRKWKDDPATWAEDVLGLQLWSKQVEIATSVRDNRYTAVAAGHGVGKSFVAAVIALWWWDTHPLGELDTFVATTAPSKDQVDLIWGNIRTFHALWQQRYKDGLVDHEIPGLYITGDNKAKLSDGQTIGQGRKPPDSKSDVAFQGRHATYLLAIGDEAVGLSKGFLNALGVIATGEGNRILLLANPTDPSSAMASYWPDPEGRGGNPEWTRIHISVMDNPMFTHEPGFDLERAKGLTSPDFLDWAEQEYGGKDDPRYIARVLGQWAWDNGAGLFPEEVLSRAMRTVVVPDPEFPRRRFGVDVSRMGVDSTQVYMCETGWVWEVDEDTGKPARKTEQMGLHVRYIDSWTKTPVSSVDPNRPGTAQKLDALAMEYGAEVINIDASGGLGGGLFDALADIAYEHNGRPYFVYEVFGGDTRNVDRRAHLNLRAAMYSELKRMMAAGELDLDPADKDLFDELRGIRAKMTPTQQLQIESKEDMKRRGVKSPDRADALWYAVLDSDTNTTGLRPGDILAMDPEDLFDDESGSFWFGQSATSVGAFGW